MKYDNEFRYVTVDLSGIKRKHSNTHTNTRLFLPYWRRFITQIHGVVTYLFVGNAVKEMTLRLNYIMLFATLIFTSLIIIHI